MKMLKEYLFAQQQSNVWDVCLSSLAQELESHLDSQSLLILMRGTGERMAKSMPSMEAAVLEDVEHALNQQWKKHNWGWVSLAETGNVVEIRHYFSPLNGAFGKTSQVWTQALLEGFYSSIFHSLGASTSLGVRQEAMADDDTCMVLNLASI